MSCNSIDYFFFLLHTGKALGNFSSGEFTLRILLLPIHRPTPTKFCTTKLVPNSAGALNKSISFLTFNVCEAHLWEVVINNPLSKLQNRYSRGRQDLNVTCKC